ncbi:hypothetical protein BH10PSE19_BH10PSE19_10390 [soil metagenome]
MKRLRALLAASEADKVRLEAQIAAPKPMPSSSSSSSSAPDAEEEDHKDMQRLQALSMKNFFTSVKGGISKLFTGGDADAKPPASLPIPIAPTAGSLHGAVDAEELQVRSDGEEQPAADDEADERPTVLAKSGPSSMRKKESDDEWEPEDDDDDEAQPASLPKSAAPSRRKKESDSKIMASGEEKEDESVKPKGKGLASMRRSSKFKDPKFNPFVPVPWAFAELKEIMTQHKIVPIKPLPQECLHYRQGTKELWIKAAVIGLIQSYHNKDKSTKIRVYLKKYLTPEVMIKGLNHAFFFKVTLGLIQALSKEVKTKSSLKKPKLITRKQRAERYQAVAEFLQRAHQINVALAAEVSGSSTIIPMQLPTAGKLGQPSRKVGHSSAISSVASSSSSSSYSTMAPLLSGGGGEASVSAGEDAAYLPIMPAPLPPPGPAIMSRAAMARHAAASASLSMSASISSSSSSSTVMDPTWQSSSIEYKPSDLSLPPCLPLLSDSIHLTLLSSPRLSVLATPAPAQPCSVKVEGQAYGGGGGYVRTEMTPAVSSKVQPPIDAHPHVVEETWIDETPEPGALLSSSWPFGKLSG